MNDQNIQNLHNPVNELVTALAKAQLEIKAPRKDKVNTNFKSKYSSLDAIYESCREPLAKNGLVMSHSVEGQTLVTTLRHVSGQSISCSVPMFIDKTTSQGFGSALTYARKYSVCSLLSLPSDEDDDGNAAEVDQKAAPVPHVMKRMSSAMSPGDAQILRDLMEAHPDGEEIVGKALGIHKVSSIAQLPASSFELLRAALR